MRWFTSAGRSPVSRLHGLGERTARWLDKETWRLLDRFEPLGRAVRNVTTIEAFDLALILAAQAFLTMVPLVIVLAAFAPRLLGVQLSAQLQGSLGLANSSLAFQSMLANPGRVARVGGAVGLFLLVSAGISFVTALQRAYERVWQLPRLGVVRSSWRALAWLIVCTLGFVLSGLADVALRGVPAGTAVLTLIGVIGAVLLWWWTPHLLLGARVGWRALLPSAVLTGGQLVVLVWLSPLIMPTFVATTEGEFGPLGTVFVVMIWLTIVCSMVVFGGIIGEVIARDRRAAPWTRPPAPQTPGSHRGRARPGPGGTPPPSPPTDAAADIVPGLVDGPVPGPDEAPEPAGQGTQGQRLTEPRRPGSDGRNG